MSEQIGEEVRRVFAGPLLAWYRDHRRNLPWRRRVDDPYAVWVSEIMLQQTQVATVIPYYERWMSRFPTLESLARAPVDEALRFWAGLGYYARARNLHRAAQAVLESYGGVVPSQPGAIESLPGVGRYTAGAIRSIAFNQPAPILDANVIRVLSRVFVVDGDPRSSLVQRRLWALAEELIPEGEPGDFNQALMELGALVCTPSDPACDQCPLLPVCRAGDSENPARWPQIPAGRKTVGVTHCSALLRDDDRVLVVRRPPHGLWGGLWEFPRRVCDPGESPADCAARAVREVVGVDGEASGKVATVKHQVTHHAITLHMFAVMGDISGARPRDCAEVRLATLEDLGSLPLSAPQRLLAETLERERELRRQGWLDI